MSLLKHLNKDLKIFFYLVAVRYLLRGTSLETFRSNMDQFKDFKNHNKFSNIHNKLTNKNIITADELEFLIEYERKRQWEKF